MNKVLNALAGIVIVLVSVASSNAATIALEWNKNLDPVDGYTLHKGPTGTTTTNTTFKDIKNIPANIRNGKMFIEFGDAELGLSTGDPICFRLKAYNIVGSSGLSKAVCTVKKSIPSIPTGLGLKYKP